ncbi:MAG: hypothetical protein BZY88_07650 [SAR202 cluster bacterium Io17-Chloro-G9]|nr:MAG: hypothetical protein BZY88_07650 [SAR202 cluster bacterium Io17-Chloro-G9]
MVHPDPQPDVIIIGGGPAGSTTATMLARQGVRVLLFEREKFPRHHVGESLLPASLPVLEELGVLPAVEQAGFLRKWGATMIWGKDAQPWSWYFRETSSRYPHSYQVWRPQFDKLLLDNSRGQGVDVREGHRVVQVLYRHGKPSGVRFNTQDGATGTATCRLVVDASGQGGLVGRTLGLRRWDTFFQNLAVYAYFEGTQSLPPPDETNIFIESYFHGWFWNIPLHTGQAGIGAVVDSITGQEGIQRLGLDQFLAEQIAQARQTTAMLQDATMVSGPFVVKDWSYTSEPMVGDGYILVGDAACFVDPLFSSGVHLALMGGVMAAALAVSTLKDPGIADAAGRAYQELYLQEYSHFREMARLFYTSNLTSDSYFWEARRILGQSPEQTREAPENFSPRHAFIRAVAGQPPRGYERAVLERGQAPAEFSESVRAVELDRARRREKLDGVSQNPGALHASVPKLRPGVAIERRPVLGQGEFVWSQVIASPGQSQGTPCSPLVALLVSLIDGETPVAGILDVMCRDTAPDQVDAVTENALAALGILYVDGSIEELRGL